MADEVGQEPVVETPSVETPAVETPQAVDTGNSPQEQSEGHPAWAPIREALGDIQFHKIKPFLQEFDSQAQKRVTETNSKYEPWKSFETQGITPDVVKRAIGIVQGIDQNPLQMYQVLEQHLRSQGLIQEANAVHAEAQAEANRQGVDPDEEEDPRDAELRALKEQQEQIQQFLEAQRQEQMQAEYDRQADAALDAEINSLRQARPGMQKEEEAAIFQRFALHVKAGQYDYTLEKAAAEFDAERNRILSQPRPNDLAPRIPGAGGGAPTGTPQQKKPEEFTREESQAYFADLLMRGKQS